MKVTRKDALLSFGAAAGTAILAGCGGSSLATPARSPRNVVVLPAGVRRGKASFPLWPTQTKLSEAARRRLHVINPIYPGDPGGGGGSPSDPPSPTGRPPTRVYRSTTNWTAYGYREDNVSSLYDDTDSLVLQTQWTLNADYTFSVQTVDSNGTATWYSLPSFDTVPINTWCSLLGSNYYLDSSTHTATLQGVDGRTYTFTRNANNDLVISSNDGTPNVVIPSTYLVGARPFGKVHTAGIACNAASFALGFFGAAVVLSAAPAMLRPGAGKVAAGATGILTAMYNGANAVCHNVSW